METLKNSVDVANWSVKSPLVPSLTLNTQSQDIKQVDLSPNCTTDILLTHKWKFS